MLSVHKTQRTYEPQFYVSEFELRGAMKMLEERIERHDDRAAYYIGAHMALNVLFFGYGGEGAPTSTDYPHEFVLALDEAINDNMI